MRINLPVTQRNHPFPSGQSLVSATDRQGRILYCNAAFVEVSGFERHELLGQPHNLIRHPDMPAEAFRDLWATVGCGKPWSGMVKNRRKNGDHYWVQANVTPLVDGEQIVGYLSVRTEPGAAQIEAAEALYARMRDEAGRGERRTTLVAGHVEPVGLAGLIGRLRQLSLGVRFAGIAMTTCTLSALAGLTAGSWLGHGWLGAAAAMGAASGLAVAAWAWMHARVQTPLRTVMGQANRIAAGNLVDGVTVRSRGEFEHLERALNQMVVNVRAVVADARQGVSQLQSIATELAAGSQDLSMRTESQASSLQQTASSMEQITSSVRQSADSAHGAADFATRINEVSRRGASTVEDVHTTMSGIEASSERISSIIQVIDSIAFQTNILALNAAVEAARAGEQGRGFAVVAAEVRGLAQRTTAAAREVKQLIDDASLQVVMGARQADAARQTMSEAAEGFRQVTDLIQAIHHGTAEQLDGIAQVNTAVTQIDNFTQRNAALVEQLAAAASALSAQSGEVADSMTVFRLEGGGRQADAVELRRRMKATAETA